MNSSQDIEIIKSFPISKGRPATAPKNEKGQNINKLQAIKKYSSEHREIMNKSQKKYELKKKEKFDQYHLIVSVIKELINQQKITLPNDLIQLIQTI